MSIDHSITHIRPRFSYRVEASPDVILEQIKLRKLEFEGKVIVSISGHHIILDIPGNDRHFYTPQLWVRIEEVPEGSGNYMLKGMVGPRPEIWTMFIFFYFGIGILGFALSLYASSSWMLGNFSHWIWAFPVAILIMLTAYQAGKEGEKLAHDQVEQLKGFLRVVLQNLKAEENK